MNDVTTTEPNKKSGIALLQEQIDQRKGQLAQMLPAQIHVDKFIRTTMTAVLMDPALLNADRQSLMNSCMRAAQDGLLCDKREAALVIFNTKEGDNWVKKVQYMPMFFGLLKKMRNTGELASISAHVVYAKDKFVYVMGDNESIIHEPFLDGEPGDVKFAYAIAKLKDGSVQREVMTRAQIDKVRAVSKSGDKGPWVSWFDEMARKTVLRRVSKYLPSSPEIDSVLKADDDTYDLVDVTPEGDEPKKLGTQGVKDKMKGKKGKATSIDNATGEVISSESSEQNESTPPALYQQLAEKFAADCDAAVNIGDLALLRHNNRDFLDQTSGKAPKWYDYAVKAYNLRMKLLGGSAQQMMSDPRAVAA